MRKVFFFVCLCMFALIFIYIQKSSIYTPSDIFPRIINIFLPNNASLDNLTVDYSMSKSTIINITDITIINSTSTNSSNITTLALSNMTCVLNNGQKSKFYDIILKETKYNT